MRDAVERSLQGKLDATIVSDLLDAYEKLVAEAHLADHASALMHAGRFVEHSLRAIEFIRSGKVPTEIKSVSAEIRKFENDVSLNDSLRYLIPRAAYGMIYDIRSKRNAVHVNEIDPSSIDAALAIATAGWILSEFLRLYHNAPEKEIKQLLATLSRGRVPLIEVIEDEALVTSKVPVNVELLLLLTHASPKGLTRTDLGRLAKCSASSVTRGLRSLTDERLVHLSRENRHIATGAGEAYLAEWLSTNV